MVQFVPALLSMECVMMFLSMVSLSVGSLVAVAFGASVPVLEVFIGLQLVNVARILLSK